MLGFGGASSGLWPILHFWSGWTALALGAMHLALHWRWVLTVAGSMVRGRAATRSRGGRPAVGLQVSMALAAAAIVFVSAMYGGALAGNALASHSSSSAGDAVATATQVAQVSSVSNAAATASGSSTTSTGSTTSGTSSSSSSTLQTCPRTGCTSQGCHHSQ